MKRRSTKLLIWLALSFLVAGVIEGYLPDDSSDFGPLYVPHTMLVAVLTFAWCKSHARENNIASPGGYPVFSAIVPPLGIPIYFFKFFGFREGGVKILKSLGFALILGSGYLVPYTVIQELNV